MLAPMIAYPRGLRLYVEGYQRYFNAVIVQPCLDDLNKGLFVKAEPVLSNCWIIEQHVFEPAKRTSLLKRPR